MAKKIILVRHADFDEFTGGITDHEIKTVRSLAECMEVEFGEGPITIWTSPTTRAEQTAKIIQEEISLAQVVIKDGFDDRMLDLSDLDALKDEINASGCDRLIIVTHKQCVRYLPTCFGFRRNDHYGYAQGVVIEDKYCLKIG